MLSFMKEFCRERLSEAELVSLLVRLSESWMKEE